MNVLGLVGSYRKNGNTELAVNEVLKGAQSEGAEIESVFLKDYEIKDCIGCEGCRDSFKCVLKDDMNELYQKLYEADAIVLGSPTYFYNVTGIIKNFIDRLYCQEIFDETDRSVWMGLNEAVGMKYATVVAICEQESSEDMGYTAITMTKSLQALGYRVVNEVKIFKTFERKALLKEEEQVKQSFDAGVKLAKTLKLKARIQNAWK